MDIWHALTPTRKDIYNYYINMIYYTYSKCRLIEKKNSRKHHSLRVKFTVSCKNWPRTNPMIYIHCSFFYLRTYMMHMYSIVMGALLVTPKQSINELCARGSCKTSIDSYGLLLNSQHGHVPNYAPPKCIGWRSQLVELLHRSTVCGILYWCNGQP